MMGKRVVTFQNFRFSILLTILDRYDRENDLIVLKSVDTGTFDLNDYIAEVYANPEIQFVTETIVL